MIFYFIFGYTWSRFKKLSHVLSIVNRNTHLVLSFNSFYRYLRHPLKIVTHVPCATYFSQSQNILRCGRLSQVIPMFFCHIRCQILGQPATPYGQLGMTETVSKSLLNIKSNFSFSIIKIRICWKDCLLNLIFRPT